MPRPAGSKNRVSACVKDNILQVFEDIGGKKSMARWAKANEDAYYRMYGSLAPKEIALDATGDLTIQLLSQSDRNDSPATDPDAT